MEKEYVFMKLSAVQCHTLRVMNVDCRGNMKSVDFTSFTGCMFVYCSCLSGKLKVDMG